MSFKFSGNATINVGKFSRLAKRLGGAPFQTELFRAVVDTGRKEKTLVQKSVFKQMAMKRYGFVAQNTRGTPRKAILAFDMRAKKVIEKFRTGREVFDDLLVTDEIN